MYGKKTVMSLAIKSKPDRSQYVDLLRKKRLLLPHCMFHYIIRETDVKRFAAEVRRFILFTRMSSYVTFAFRVQTDAKRQRPPQAPPSQENK